MSRRQQRIDLGLADPHEAISAISVPPERAATPTFDACGACETPPGSSFAPVPLMRCPPRGPDPFTAERAAVHARAAAGELCPVNQHGCMYFSASEWRFCRMCEWETGVALGKRNGALGKLGITPATFTEESARGLDLTLTLEEAKEVLKMCEAFQKDIHAYEWSSYVDRFSSGDSHYFTRSQIHNFLMHHGCPCDVLTDEMWAELKARYDGPAPEDTPAVPPVCPLLEALGLAGDKEIRAAPTPAVPGNEAMAACVGDTLRELLEDLQRERDGLPPLERPPSITSYERLPDGRVRVEGGRPPFVEKPPTLTLAEIMRQEAAGIGPAAPLAPKPRVQVWKSAKLVEEEARAARRAAEEEKMADERRAAYHKRRQEALEAAGAPRCYNCGWFGHIGRVCRNERQAPPAAAKRAPARGGLTLGDFL
jgi:hypothetical protein